MGIMNESDVTKKFSLMVLVLGMFIVVSSGYIWYKYKTPEKKKYGEDIVVETNIGGDFSLTNTDGIVQNTKDFSDKYKIVYFGFTYCPDVCPTALSMMINALDIVGEHGGKKMEEGIVPIFVTIDPKRDTAEMLKKYLANFGMSIVGFTGSESAVREVADQYKVYYSVAPGSDDLNDDFNMNPNDYLMDHTSFVYFLDKESRYIHHFHSNDSPETVAKYIVDYINKK